MKALILTNKGLENVSANELRQLITVTDVDVKPGKVFFSCSSYNELTSLCYYGRTFSKVVLVLHESKISALPDESVLEITKPFLQKSVVVYCERSGNHGFTSFDVEGKLNGVLKNNYKQIIDHKRPETIIHVIIVNDGCYVGIDFSGIDLGKRDYRIFLGSNALKGNIAAALLFVAEYEPKHTLIDIFCRHGVIPIEAALMATNASVHKFSKEKLACTHLPCVVCNFKDKEKEFKGRIVAIDENFKHVSSAKKNAKIAGVNKHIDFSRKPLEDIDLKFDKSSVDRIISTPIQPGKSFAIERAARVYKKLFEQAKLVLKSDGKLCLCVRTGADLLKEHSTGFVIEKELHVMQGKEQLTVLLFSKQ